jgi:chemotaxis protein MotD
VIAMPKGTSTLLAVASSGAAASDAAPPAADATGHHEWADNSANNDQGGAISGLPEALNALSPPSEDGVLGILVSSARSVTATGGDATPSAKAATTAQAKAAPSVEAGAASFVQGAAPAGSNTDQQAGDGATRRDRSNASGSARGSLGNVESRAGAAVTAGPIATASVGAASIAAGSAVAAVGPLTVDQLPDLIANQAATLAGSASTAASAGAAMANLNPVKELKVQLNPADLGSLTVKMRLANGNLAVAIETAKDSTAKLIEGERNAIAERLASVDQPVATVTVQASAGVPHQGENNNGSGATSQQGDAQSSTANGSNGQARSSRGDDGRGEASRANSADDETSSRALSGDLFV